MTDSQLEGLVLQLVKLGRETINPPDVQKMIDGVKYAEPKDRMQILGEYTRRILPTVRNWEGLFDRLAGEPVGIYEKREEKKKVDLLLK
jgi:hypothetical protein